MSKFIKLSALCTIAILLLSMLACTVARPAHISRVEIHHSVEEEMTKEEICEGDEECLMRRTLADAHLDYIYTQNKQP
uniref:phytosulfokines-like n=1 Tax=Erigeron canadensis TaxID=72917 RepID=UPI001CB90056|nr:phytosulfokines-like [Erigeron canadensis]